MSYDLFLTADGRPAEHQDDELAWLNITWNLRPMFVRACSEAGVAEPENRGIRTIYGMSGSEAATLVRRMLRAMHADPDGYSKLDAPNGWGTRTDCEAFLQRVIDASDRYPAAIWGGD